MTFLRTAAARGVDTYKLLYSQEAPSIDKARCTCAYDGSGVAGGAPNVEPPAEDEAWEAQVEEFFVDSCVSGKPKPIPADLPHPADAPKTSTTPSTPSSAPSTTITTPTPKP